MNKNPNSCFGDNAQLGVTVAVGAVMRGPLRSWPEIYMVTAMKIWSKGVTGRRKSCADLMQDVLGLSQKTKTKGGLMGLKLVTEWLAGPRRCQLLYV